LVESIKSSLNSLPSATPPFGDDAYGLDTVVTVDVGDFHWANGKKKERKKENITFLYYYYFLVFLRILSPILSHLVSLTSYHSI